MTRFAMAKVVLAFFVADEVDAIDTNIAAVMVL